MQPGLLAAFLLNAGLFGGSYLLLLPPTRRWLRFDRYLAAFVIGSTFLVLMLETLSQFRQMTFVGCSIVVGLWFGCGMIRALPTLRMAAVKLAIDESDSLIRGWRSWPAIAAIVVAAWALLYYLMRGLVLPVEPVSDGPIYHLPFALRWRQEANIVPVATPFGELAATYFPVNGDLWLAWLLIGGGDETLAKVGQWPFAVIGAFIIWGLSCRLGAGAAASVFPAAVWSTTLVTLLTSATANVDLLFAAWMLAGVYFLVGSVESDDNETTRFLALGSLACGLAIGTKTIGIVLVPPILAGAIALALRCQHRGRNLAAVASFLLPSAYSYWRNWQLTGNPLFPLDVRLFGFEVLTGWLDRSAMHRTSYHIPIDQWRWLADRLANVVDLRLAWLWLVAGAVVVLGIGFASDRRRRWIAIAIVGLAIVQLALYWFVVPYNAQERFLLGAMAIAVAPLGRIIDGRPVVQLALVVLIGWHLLTPNWGLSLTGEQPKPTLLPMAKDPLSGGKFLYAAALPLALAGAVLWIRFVRTGRWTVAALMIFGGCFIATYPTRSFFAQHPYLRFYPRWEFSRQMVDAWEILDQAAGPKGANVAYAGTNLPYFLYGHNLRNRVRYVNVNRHEGWLAHEYHAERRARGMTSIADSPWPGWYREEAEYEAWVENLRKEKITLLLVAMENQHGKATDQVRPGWPVELKWAREHPERFEALGPFGSEQAGAVVFRVK